jgi:hypothetical protein
MTTLPPFLFELEDMGLRLEPTIAMRNGQQAVFQCANCGLVAVQTNLAPGPLGACPACGRGDWHQQELPVAGLRKIEVNA